MKITELFEGKVSKDQALEQLEDAYEKVFKERFPIEVDTRRQYGSLNVRVNVPKSISKKFKDDYAGSRDNKLLQRLAKEAKSSIIHFYPKGPVVDKGNRRAGPGERRIWEPTGQATLEIFFN